MSARLAPSYVALFPFPVVCVYRRVSIIPDHQAPTAELFFGLDWAFLVSFFQQTTETTSLSCDG